MSSLNASESLFVYYCLPNQTTHASYGFLFLCEFFLTCHVGFKAIGYTVDFQLRNYLKIFGFGGFFLEKKKKKLSGVFIVISFHIYNPPPNKPPQIKPENQIQFKLVRE